MYKQVGNKKFAMPITEFVFLGQKVQQECKNETKKLFVHLP